MIDFHNIVNSLTSYLKLSVLLLIIKLSSALLSIFCFSEEEECPVPHAANIMNERNHKN